MACEHLVEGRMTSCEAVSGQLIPSLHERERYCRSDDNHRCCPTFQASAAAQRRLAQEEYYALWTVPRMPELRPVAPQLRVEEPAPLVEAV